MTSVVADIECPRCHTTARYVGYSATGTQYVCDNLHVITIPAEEGSTGNG